jgi:hypothetical protein
MLLIIGYKSGFSLWTVDLNGMATEVLSIKEPNIKRVKLLSTKEINSVNNNNKLLIAICKHIIVDAVNNNSNNMNNNHQSSSSTEENYSIESTATTTSAMNYSPHSNNILAQKQEQISIVNLLDGECLHEITFNGEILEMKSNGYLLCVNSWNRIDAFDMTINFEHRFSINSCYSEISKSSGQLVNPFTLGDRWLAFADNKFHLMLTSQGGMSSEVEQS